MVRLRLIVSWLRRFCGRRPQREIPKPKVVVPADRASPAGSLREPDLYCVSRHGLLQGGITCPACGHPAAQEREWARIRRTSRSEEFVECARCSALLFASPDDQVDPVSQLRRYDRAKYHTFERVAEPRVREYQRHIPQRPELGDWVVLMRCTSVDGKDLDGVEGRLVHIDGEIARVALAGNTGLGGTGEMGGTFVHIPITHCFPMLMHTIRVGSAVRFVKGERFGALATVLESHRGSLLVHCADGSQAECLIEHVEPHHPLARTTRPPDLEPVQEIPHG
jgi:hypothetical protein